MIVISYMPHLYTWTPYVCLGLFWTKIKVKTILDSTHTYILITKLTEVPVKTCWPQSRLHMIQLALNQFNGLFHPFFS